MEVTQTTHLRRTHRIPHTMFVPSKPVLRSSKALSIESGLIGARLRTWGQACRDSLHSFFRTTVFGRAVNERPFFAKKKQPQYVTLIKDAVFKFCEPEYSQLRDWPLDPEPLLDAQDMYHGATVEAWPLGKKSLNGLTPMMSPHPRMPEITLCPLGRIRLAGTCEHRLDITRRIWVFTLLIPRERSLIWHFAKNC